MGELERPGCVEHVWVLTAASGDSWGAALEYECSRCGEQVFEGPREIGGGSD